MRRATERPSAWSEHRAITTKSGTGPSLVGGEMKAPQSDRERLPAVLARPNIDAVPCVMELAGITIAEAADL